MQHISIVDECTEFRYTDIHLWGKVDFFITLVIEN